MKDKQNHMTVHNTSSCSIEKSNDEKLQQSEKISSSRERVKIQSCLIKDHLQHHVLDGGDQLLKKISLIQKFHNKFHQNPESCSDDEFVCTVPVGMTNLGNTCYVNSQIQCITADLSLTQALFSFKLRKGDEKMNDSILQDFLELRSTFFKLFLGSSNVLDTEDLCKALQINAEVMGDPHEFFHLITRKFDSFGRKKNHQINDESNLFNGNKKMSQLQSIFHNKKSLLFDGNTYDTK